MTRGGVNGDKVGFSGPTWMGIIGLLLTAVGMVGGLTMQTESRVTAIETTSAEHTRRLDAGDVRDNSLRQEILTELRELRQQITK